MSTRFKTLALLSALLALSACTVVPPQIAYVGPCVEVVTPAPYYAPRPYYTPAPYYAPGPAYYGGGYWRHGRRW